MKTHLTEEEVLDLAFTKLNIANPNIDKIIEIADSLDLEFDEENNAYKNPNYKHITKKKTLNVKKKSKKEIQEKWETTLMYNLPNTLYIRCNSKGEINWEIAPVYTINELEKRGNYNILN